MSDNLYASKAYYLSVAEPWDFESPDGKNRIEGAVVRSVQGNMLLFKANHLIRLQDIEGNLLVLQPRYERTFDNFFKLGSDTVNARLLPEGYDPESTAHELELASKFVIIGGIHKK